jgi:hypothetical protein
VSLTDPSVLACWVWNELAPSERRARFRGLYRWVAWLRTAYDADRLIYPCWYQHSYAREELRDLWVAWIRTYHETGGSTHLAFPSWQDTRDRVLTRVKHNLDEAGCTSHDHKQPYQPTPTPPGRHPEELFASWLTDDPWINAAPTRELAWQARRTADTRSDDPPVGQQDRLDLPEPDP